MAGKTKIEWTAGGKTWNPLAGCSVISPGCKHCYAARQAVRLEAMAEAHFNRTGEAGPLDHYRGTTEQVVKADRVIPVWSGKLHLAPSPILLAPLRWREPTTIFVNSMSDLFHESVEDAWLDQIFAVMMLCPQHTFQILTKREKRMRRYIEKADLSLAAPLGSAIAHLAASLPPKHREYSWPLPNVWLGVSVEDQARADERISWLLGTPAAVRFLSCEPLLGPVSLKKIPFIDGNPLNTRDALTGQSVLHAEAVGDAPPQRVTFADRLLPTVDWVIVGGESGPDARPMDPVWARQLRDECVAASVPFFFKQWGEWHADALRYTDARTGECPPANMKIGKKKAGRMLDGQVWDQMPVRSTEVA